MLSQTCQLSPGQKLLETFPFEVSLASLACIEPTLSGDVLQFVSERTRKLEGCCGNE